MSRGEGQGKRATVGGTRLGGPWKQEFELQVTHLHTLCDPFPMAWLLPLMQSLKAELAGPKCIQAHVHSIMIWPWALVLLGPGCAAP